MLDSIMGGGGGGNIFGMVGGLVGGIFGGPMGAMIGKALGNMIGQAVGEATKQAADTLAKEDGMPNFLKEEIKKMVDEKIDQLQDKSVDCDCQQEVNDKAKDFKEQLVEALAKEIVEGTREERANQKSGVGGSEQASSGKNDIGANAADDTSPAAQIGQPQGTKKNKSEEEDDGSGGWLVAIAKAMGKALGAKAAQLAQTASDLASKMQAGVDMEQGTAEQKQNAADVTKLNSLLQGQSQEFTMITTAFATSIKSLGEGMATMGRKN
jgi:hypothetical protein